MAYNSGGVIQALDYNLLTWGGNTTGTYANVAGQPNLAWIYGVGKGVNGYGQNISALTAVTGSSTQTITATQWATFVYMLNLALGHQGKTQLASGSNIGIVSGSTITAFSNVATSVAQVVSTANTAYAQGTTITGSVFTYNQVTGNAAGFVQDGVAYSGSFNRTVTFSSGDAARYFFNAGGQINFVITGVTGNTNVRGSDWANIWITDLKGVNFTGNSSTRTGTGGGNIHLTTTLGYWGANTTTQLAANVSGSGGGNGFPPSGSGYTYNNDYAYIGIKNNGGQGTNLDNGSILTITGGWYQFPNYVAYQDGNIGFNQAVNLTISHRIDIIPPETTFLGNTWGVIGIT